MNFPRCVLKIVTFINSFSNISGGVSRQVPRRTHRIIRQSSVRGRSGSSSVSASGSMISTRPTTYVPEDLISQAQSVLQGRSRNLIIRELQRTNLDVNLAVNNLLSRDEEDGDDGDDGNTFHSVKILGVSVNSDFT